MFSLENPPPPGMKQLKKVNNELVVLHNPESGWPIITPKSPCSIWLQDDLTFVDGKIAEIENYIEYYKDDIKDVTFYVWHRYLEKLYPKLNFIYFPKFHYDHRKDAVKQNVPDKFNFSDTKQYVFMCLNMNRRKHRDRAVKLLQTFPNRLISYKAANWQIFEHDNDIDIDGYANLNLTHPEMLSNTYNLLQLQPVYQKCQFSVVTETRYNLRFDFITEKTTQCFLALHPALYVSNQGHVQMLRDYGFDVFDDVFDHSYDGLGEGTRINYLVESNKDVLTNGIPNYTDLKQRLLANRNHYLSEDCPLIKIKG